MIKFYQRCDTNRLERPHYVLALKDDGTVWARENIQSGQFCRRKLQALEMTGLFNSPYSCKKYTDANNRYTRY